MLGYEKRFKEDLLESDFTNLDLYKDFQSYIEQTTKFETISNTHLGYATVFFNHDVNPTSAIIFECLPIDIQFIYFKKWFKDVHKIWITCDNPNEWTFIDVNSITDYTKTFAAFNELIEYLLKRINPSEVSVKSLE